MNSLKNTLLVLAVALTVMAISPPEMSAQPVWQKVEIPDLPEWAEYLDLWSASPTDVFVVTGRHEAYKNLPHETMVYYFDGSDWTKIFDEVGYWNYHYNVIFGTSPSDVYLVANKGPQIHQGDGYIWHYDGICWQEMVVPAQWTQGWWYNCIGGSKDNIHMFIQGQRKHVIRYDGQDWSFVYEADTYGLMREFISPDEGYLSNWTGWWLWPNWAKWNGSVWVPSVPGWRRYTQFSIWGTRDQDNTLYLYDGGDPAYASRFIVTRINEDLIGWQNVVNESASPGFGLCNGVWGPKGQGVDIYAVGYFYGGSWGGDGSGLARVWHTSDGVNWDIIDDDIAFAVGVPKLGERGYQVWGTSSDDVWIVIREALYHLGQVNTPPVANAGPDQTLECTSCCATEVALDGIGSCDPDADLLTYTWRENSDVIAGPTTESQSTVTLPLGEHLIELTVDDGKGGTDTDEVICNIVDTTPPDISVVLNPDELWPPNHKMVSITAAVTVSDICDEHATFVLTSITSNEPDNAPGSGDGNTVDDIQDADIGTPDIEFFLRAERDGNGDGRIYRVVYSAIDGSENSVTLADTVWVPYSQGKLKKTQMFNEIEIIPVSIRLFQNSPNPFNPETLISYTLPRQIHVTLEVFNIIGDKVVTLVNNQISAGYHSVMWDGRDELGRMVSGGIYLCRMKAGTYQQTIRVLLLK